MDDMTPVVNEKHDKHAVIKIDNAFITLQSCLYCALSCDGGHHYKIPYMNKAGMRQMGVIGTLPCRHEATDEALDFAETFAL
jgi:hypothetical protein